MSSMAESVSKQLLSAVTEGHTRRNSPSTSHSSRRNKRHTTTSESIDNNRDRSRSRIRNNKVNQSYQSNESQQSPISSKRSPSTTLSSGYKSEDSEAINSIASRTRSHSQRKSFDPNNSAVTPIEKQYRSESDTSELRQTDTEGEEYTPNKQSTQRRKKESNTSRRSALKKSTTTQRNTTTDQKPTSGERRRKLRSSNSRTDSATTSTSTSNSSAQNSSPTSTSSVIPKKRFRQSDPEALNLGARLAKSSSGREPQQRTSIQESHSGQPPSLLRRSSRSKGNLINLI